jgi:hypothetical protein
VKLGQTNGERGDDQARKQANGRIGGGGYSRRQRENYSTGVRMDRDRPISANLSCAAYSSP